MDDLQFEKEDDNVVARCVPKNTTQLQLKNKNNNNNNLVANCVTKANRAVAI